MYKFKSQAAADVLMLTPQGDRLLGLLGREPSRQGILEVADMPAALAALASAIAAEEALAVSGADALADRTAASSASVAAAQGGEPGSAARDAVSLRQRAFPLQAMIQRCLAAKQPIVWGV
jgi:hypothetical protein